MSCTVLLRRADRIDPLPRVRELLEGCGWRELIGVGSSVVIKPNLNNDLHALTGNSTDLRVICALIEALLDDGRRDLVVADGPNVGVERRGIDVFRRLRVANLGNRYPVRLVDLNRDEGVFVELPDGRPRVARTWLEAPIRISVPTLKTHAEMGLSCAMKNHVGTVVAQDKRLVHRDPDQP